ncbi:MAG TPA: anti-sigma regulatory factor [Bacilli bacterium]|nr:anti-sigma regulatory factor [Bacilli bacterium]
MQETIQIHNETDAIVARQRGRDMARRLGFSVVDQTRIAISISELARNMILYADHGEVLICEIRDPQGEVGLEVQVVDNGPGIADLEQAMSDGFSTSNGLGMGLPGTKRLMDDFVVETAPGSGTKITIRKWLHARYM